MTDLLTRRDELLLALTDYRGPETLRDFWLFFRRWRNEPLSYGKFMQHVLKLKREGRIAYENGFIYEKQQA